MSGAISLFKEIQGGGYQACLATTFSLDFGFYEGVLLRRMRAKGVRHNMLFADERMTSVAMKNHPPEKVGAQYSLATMRGASAFHPKLLILLGEKKGFMAVGSHNLTLSGFGINLEATSIVRYSKDDPENVGVFRQALTALETWIEDYGKHLPSETKVLLGSTRNLSPWLEDEDIKGSERQASFHFSSRSVDSLWDQVGSELSLGYPSVTALAPFFDQGLEFAETLASVSREKPILAIDPEATDAPSGIVDNNRFDLRDLKGFDPLRSPDSAREHLYRHAKVLFLSKEDNPMLVVGSANLSSPAWLQSGKGNAEGILVLRGSLAKAGFDALSINEIERLPALARPITKVRDHDSSCFDVATTQILTAPDDGEFLKILVPSESEVVSAWYDVAGRVVSVPIQHRDGHILIEKQYLKPGKVLFLGAGNIGRFQVVVNQPEFLKEQTLTGTQFRLRQALGSLDTDDADMQLLFSCIDKLVIREASSNELRMRNPKVDSVSRSELIPDSLVIDREDTDSNRDHSGWRVAKGRLAMLLDALYSVAREGVGQAAESFGEDADGRNEELQARMAKDNDGEEAPPDEQLVSTGARKEKGEYARKKAEGLLKRISQGLQPSYSRDPEGEQVARVLAAAAVFRQLFRFEYVEITEYAGNVFTKKKRGVKEETISALAKTVFATIFSEKQGFGNDSESKEISSSHEYHVLLGFAAWLAWVCGYQLASRLRLSVMRDDRYEHNRQNAALVFLAQRLCNNESASLEAARLLSDYGQAADLWLSGLLKLGHSLQEKRCVQELSGYDLVSSPKGAFVGVMLAIPSDEDDVHVLKMGADEPGRFQRSYLELIEAT